MALNPTTLSAAIKSGLLADLNVKDNASLQALCDAIAQAVVTHIVSSAVVTVAGTIAGTGGGPAPVVGTCAATGTIS